MRHATQSLTNFTHKHWRSGLRESAGRSNRLEISSSARRRHTEGLGTSTHLVPTRLFRLIRAASLSRPRDLGVFQSLSRQAEVLGQLELDVANPGVARAALPVVDMVVGLGTPGVSLPELVKTLIIAGAWCLATWRGA